jgi:hypothetical protein
MTTISLGLAISLMVMAVVLTTLAAVTTMNIIDFSYKLSIYYNYDVALKNKIVALTILGLISVIITVSLIGTI